MFKAKINLLEPHAMENTFAVADLCPFHCFSYLKHLTAVFTNVIRSRLRRTSQYQLVREEC